MDEVNCKGSFFFQTACQRCSKCIREADEMWQKLDRLKRLESQSLATNSYGPRRIDRLRYLSSKHGEPFDFYSVELCNELISSLNNFVAMFDALEQVLSYFYEDAR